MRNEEKNSLKSIKESKFRYFPHVLKEIHAIISKPLVARNFNISKGKHHKLRKMLLLKGYLKRNEREEEKGRKEQNWKREKIGKVLLMHGYIKEKKGKKSKESKTRLGKKN